MSQQMHNSLNSMSINSLLTMASDIRAQADIGLMSGKEAHEQINNISSVVMKKQLEEMGLVIEDSLEE